MIQLSEIEGLGDEGEDPAVERLGGGFAVAACGDHHHGNARVDAAQLFERLEPVHHRHVQVDEHEIGTTAKHGHDAVRAVGSRLDLVGVPVVEAREELRQDLTDGFFVVDDEDPLRELLRTLIHASHGSIFQKASEMPWVSTNDWHFFPGSYEEDPNPGIASFPGLCQV